MIEIGTQNGFTETEREIHANVLVEYDVIHKWDSADWLLANEAGGIYVKTPSILQPTTTGHIVPANKSVRKYLKQVMEPTVQYGSIGDFLLDGSVRFTSKYIDGYQNDYSGFVSDWRWDGVQYFITNHDGTEYSSNELGWWFGIQNGITPLADAPITIIFENGYPTSMEIYSDNIGDALVINDSNRDKYFVNDETLMIKASEGFQLTDDGLIINIGGWSKANARPTIGAIYIGTARSYNNDEIISITTNESVNLLNTETPSNNGEIELTTNGEFDVLNKDSYVPMLSDKTSIVIRYGAKDGRGITWVYGGAFYLRDWRNNDGSVVIYGEGILGSLSEEPIVNFGNATALQNQENLQKWLDESYSVESNYRHLFNTWIDENFYIHTPGSSFIVHSNESKVLTILQKICTWCGGYIQSSRSYPYWISLKRTSFTPQYRLSNDLMESDKVSIKQRTKIKQIEAHITTSLGGEATTVQEFVAKTTSYLVQGDGVVNIDSNGSFSLYYGATFVVTDEEENILSDYEVGNGQVYTRSLKFPSTYDGQELLITVYATNVPPSNTKENVFVFSVNNEGDTLVYEWSPAGNDDTITPMITRLLPILNCDKEFEVETFGDPHLEAGDCISIETNYGDQVGIITDQTLKFDGGLRATLKGVIIDVE